MHRIIPIIIAMILVVPLQSAAAQELSLASKAQQDSVEVNIGADGSVHVQHVVRSSSVPVQIELISGVREGITVTGTGGEELQYAMISGDQNLMLFPSRSDMLIEYQLKDELVSKGGVWTWNFRYLESTKFFFPDNIDMIFITEKPIMLDEKKAINCHGCQMVLEFFEDMDVQTETVIWEEHDFTVPILSVSQIESFRFEQPSRSITFEVVEPDRLVTLIMPRELLGDPYTVLLEDERVFKHDYVKNGTHVWVSIKPDSAGTVTVIGTTVIPEFSLFLPLILSIGMVAVLRHMLKARGFLGL